MAAFTLAEASRLANDGEIHLAILLVSHALREPHHASNTELLKKRASLYQRLELYQYALTDLTRAAMLDQCDAACYIARSQCYRSLGMDQRTLIEYATMLKLDPTRANTYYSRGLVRDGVRCCLYTLEQCCPHQPPRPTRSFALCVCDARNE